MAALGRDETLVVLEGGLLLAGTRRSAMTPVPETDDADGQQLYTMVASSGRNFAALSQKGDLFMMGYNHFGMMGNADMSQTQSSPLTRVLFGGARVTQVAFGHFHTVVLLSGGEVHTSGCGVSGRLGHNSERNLRSFARVEALATERVVFIAAGESASAVVTLAGRVWTFGCNSRDTLGLGPGQHDHLVPKMTRPCGAARTVLVSMSHHTVAVQEDGSTYVWGDNQYEQLGLGDRDSRPWPTPLDFGPVVSVACGTNHTVVLGTDGVVYMCGFSSGRRLWRVPGVPPAVLVSVARCQSAAVTADGRLFTWHWYHPTPVHWPQSGRVGIFQRTVPPARGLAFAMLSHPRLGAACRWNALLIPDVVRDILYATLAPADPVGTLDGLVRLLGGGAVSSI